MNFQEFNLGLMGNLQKAWLPSDPDTHAVVMLQVFEHYAALDPKLEITAQQAERVSEWMWVEAQSHHEKYNTKLRANDFDTVLQTIKGRLEKMTAPRESEGRRV